MSILLKQHAPECALPGCTNRVSYHKSYMNKDGTEGAKWKMFCNYHREKGKAYADNWKLSQGCANKDGHYGFQCFTDITIADQIDINHIDGDRRNNEKVNLECLCKNCHTRITKEQGHFKTRYRNTFWLNPELFEEQTNE